MQARRRLGAAIRVVATLVMLVVLVTRVHFGSLVPRWDIDTFGWLGAAMVVTLVGIVLASLRWQRVLGTLELKARIPKLLSTYLASLFISNFLPTTIGGDVLRVSRISSENGETPRTFASVVLERLTGWAVLPLITLAALVINPTLLHLPGGGRPIRVALIVSLATLAARTRQLDPAGKGVSETTIQRNPEARAIYELHRTALGARSIERSTTESKGAAKVGGLAIKPERDLARAHRRYKRLPKTDLVERVLVAEQAFASERRLRLRIADELLVWMQFAAQLARSIVGNNVSDT